MIGVRSLTCRALVYSQSLRVLAILSLFLSYIIPACGTNAPAGSPPEAESPDDDSPLPGTPTPLEMNQDPVADSAAVANATWGVAVGGTVDSHDVFLVFGSSFAIDQSRLVTNAHVVEAAAELFGLLQAGMELVVVQHETRVYCGIDEMYVHPEYDPARPLSTPDVGIIEVDCVLPSTIVLADDATLYDLALLDDVSLCGFPGDVTLLDIELGSSRPRATCLTGSITGLRPFDLNEPTTPLNASVIQHDIQTSRGTSGGPVFDSLGRVVAINSAGTTDSTASNRFAIRVDQVRPFVAEIDLGLISPVPLAPATFTRCADRAYWNRTYSFGFDPPPGFDGPFPDDNPSASDLFAVDFVFDELLQIEISVDTALFTLDSWIDAWVEVRTDDGEILLDVEEILMPSGVEATRLEWLTPGINYDFYLIELWSVRSGLVYQFWALMTPGDFLNFGNSIRASFRSACIE